MDKYWLPKEGNVVWYVSDNKISKGKIVRTSDSDYPRPQIYLVDHLQNIWVDWVTKTQKECREIFIARLQKDITLARGHIKKRETEIFEKSKLIASLCPPFRKNKDEK